MSSIEVICGISEVISLLDASIKISNSAGNDINLSETFNAVRRQLPIILYILQTCKNNLELGKYPMLSDICEALEEILDSCFEKAQKLREIFEMTIPGEKDMWKERYLTTIRRLGRGNKVEEVMIAFANDVQLIVNHLAANFATPGQNVELENILKVMKSVKSSMAEEEHSALTFHSSGETQTINSGSGQQNDSNAHGATQYFQSGKEYLFYIPARRICLTQR